MSGGIFDGFKEYGVRVEKTEYGLTPDDRPTHFISVPASSDCIDTNGNELAGLILARRVKRAISNAHVRYVVRNEHWSKPKPKKVDVDQFIRELRAENERRKENNLRMFFGGLFGEYGA